MQYTHLFFEYLLQTKGLSERTCAIYKHVFQDFTSKTGIEDPEKIKEETVDLWRSELQKEGKSQSTIFQHLCALRSFLRWCKRKKKLTVISTDCIELPKLKERQIETVSRQTFEEIRKRLNSRELMIFDVLFSTGLRVSELVALKRTDVKGVNKITIRGKGGKVRLVFLDEQAQKSISEYEKTREDKDERLVPITTRQVERITKKHGVHPHEIRHLFATSLLDNGADIRKVQKMLGHSSITTTMVYSHVTDNGLEEEFKNFRK